MVGNRIRHMGPFAAAQCGRASPHGRASVWRRILVAQRQCAKETEAEGG